MHPSPTTVFPEQEAKTGWHLPVSISLSLSQEAFDVHFVRYREPPLTQFTHGGARLSVSLSPLSLAPDAPSRSPVALIDLPPLHLSGSPSLQCSFTPLCFDTRCFLSLGSFPRLYPMRTQRALCVTFCRTHLKLPMQRLPSPLPRSCCLSLCL